jgi:hypothetical protein
MCRSPVPRQTQSCVPWPWRPAHHDCARLQLDNTYVQLGWTSRVYYSVFGSIGIYIASARDNSAKTFSIAFVFALSVKAHCIAFHLFASNRLSVCVQCACFCPISLGSLHKIASEQMFFGVFTSPWLHRLIMILEWFLNRYAEASEKHGNVITQFQNSKRQGTLISVLLEVWRTGKITIAPLLIAQLITRLKLI